MEDRGLRLMINVFFWGGENCRIGRDWQKRGGLMEYWRVWLSVLVIVSFEQVLAGRN